MAIANPSASSMIFHKPPWTVQGFSVFFYFPHDFPSDHIFLSWQFPFLPPAARLQGTKIQRAKPLPEDTEGGDWSMMLKYRQRAQPSDGQQSGKKVEVG